MQRLSLLAHDLGRIVLPPARFSSLGSIAPAPSRFASLGRSLGRPFSTEPPKTSEDIHGALSEQQVSSKAMKRKLRAAQPTPNLPTIQQELQQQQEQQQQQHQQPAPGILQWLVSNVMMGAGITLGFILVGSIFRALMGGSTPKPRALPPAPRSSNPDDKWDFSLEDDVKTKASVTRI